MTALTTFGKPLKLGYRKDDQNRRNRVGDEVVAMKHLYGILCMIAVIIVLGGCAGLEYGRYYYFPTYPYEYADPYSDYYYYNDYYYSYPYSYRFPPVPYYYDERSKEFRHEEREEPEGREKVEGGKKD